MGLGHSKLWTLCCLCAALAIGAIACAETERTDDRMASSSPPRRSVSSDRSHGDTGSGTSHKEQQLKRKKSSSQAAPETDRKPKGIPAVVSRVIDGDTIEVARGASTLDVRLIGIDTPETVHPSQPVECYGPAASEFTRRSLEGKRVRLEFDVERTDRYGRTLAYVWLNGQLFNRTLVAAGYAQVSTYPPNVKYVDRFLAAQRKARSAGTGLWSGCEDDASGASGNGGNGSAAGVTSGGGRCDPNYKGACVAPYPPDLDCPDVPATNFSSVGSDPHGFDGDGDGVACES